MGIGEEVELRRGGGVAAVDAAALGPAAHDEDALQEGRQLGVLGEGNGQVRQRPGGHHLQLPGEALGLLPEGVPGGGGVRGPEGLRQGRAAEAVRPVDVGGGVGVPEEGTVRAGIDRHVQARESADPAGILIGVGQGDVAVDGADAPDVQGQAGRRQDGLGVVDAGVHIQPNRDPLAHTGTSRPS